MRDIRVALRRFARDPVATVVVVATLGLGIGLNAAVFSVVDAVLLDDLPVAEPDRLFKIVQTRTDRGGHYSVNSHNFLAWRDRQHTFQDLAAIDFETVIVRGDEFPERLGASRVSPEYFEVLGRGPALGRAFSPSGEASEILISDRLWHRRFGGDRAVLGQELVLEGEAHQIVGVMPPGLDVGGLGGSEIWLPFPVEEARDLEEPIRGLSVLGRLAPGFTEDDAFADMAAISRALEEERPETNASWGVELLGVRGWIVGGVEGPLWTLYGAVALVLLIACANVSGLWLARAADRRREIAVRRALGAGRGRLMRQLLVESSLLALAGGAAGLALAATGVDLLPRLVPHEIPRLEGIAVDLRVLGLGMALALFCGLVGGLAPAWLLARGHDLGFLRAGAGVGEGRGSRRWRQGLVAFQVGFAVVLVICSGLLVESLRQLQRVDPGFEPTSLLSLRVDLDAQSYPTPEARAELSHRLLGAARALPGVDLAAISGQRLPLTGSFGVFNLFPEGQPQGPGLETVVNAQMISSDYLRVMGIPLAEGRSFRPEETWDSTHTVLVNQAFVRAFWPEGEALGRWVEFTNGERGRVVGVVGDVRQLGLEREAAKEVYVATAHEAPRQVLVVRTALPPAQLIEPLRRTVAELAPDLPVYAIATGTELVGSELAERRFSAAMTALFGLIALVLGGLGIYGVLAAAVARRRREIGLRMALGAAPRALLRWVVAQGLWPVVGGIFAGLALAAGLAPLLAEQLFGVEPTDVTIFSAGALAIFLAAALASWLPARRALAVDPSRVLRDE